MPTITPEFISKTLIQVISAIIGLAISFGIHMSDAEKAAILSFTLLAIPALVEIGWLVFRGHAAAAAAPKPTSTTPAATPAITTATTPAATSAGDNSTAA